MYPCQNYVRPLAVAGLALISTSAVGDECRFPPTLGPGISLASAEFQADRIPGVYGRDYVYPPAADVDYYKQHGFDVVRLPFLWERLQRRLFGELDPTELARIKRFTAVAHDRCIRVILSPHDYGRYTVAGTSARLGTPQLPNDAFADFWRRMSIAFRDDPPVYAFSLMNEPHDMNGQWKQTAQAGLDAIRGVDSKRLVLAPGDQWSGAWSWKRFNDDFLLKDPANELIYEAHQYFDADHSGTYRQDYDESRAYPGIGVDLVRPFVDWLQAHGAAGILGEFGVPNDDARWLEVVNELLPWLNRQRVPWIYWAGGPRWGNYPLSAEPRGGHDAPIMGILTKPGSEPVQPGMRAPEPH